MEASFGRSFGGVRVHTDAAGTELAQHAGAEAVSVGERLAFAPGMFRPGTRTGDHLIAHELAHVAQAPAGSAEPSLAVGGAAASGGVAAMPAVHARLATSLSTEPAEVAAEQAAHAVGRGEPVHVSPSPSVSGLSTRSRVMRQARAGALPMLVVSTPVPGTGEIGTPRRRLDGLDGAEGADAPDGLDAAKEPDEASGVFERTAPATTVPAPVVALPSRGAGAASAREAPAAQIDDEALVALATTAKARGASREAVSRAVEAAVGERQAAPTPERTRPALAPLDALASGAVESAPSSAASSEPAAANDPATDDTGTMVASAPAAAPPSPEIAAASADVAVESPDRASLDQQPAPDGGAEPAAADAAAPQEEEAAASPRPVLVVEPQMPPPPETLGPAAQGRLEQAQSRAGGAARASGSLPSADQNTSAARSAVTEPPEQRQAEAGNALVAALDERPAPSPEIEELCQRIYQVIRSKRPPDEDALVDADPQEAAQEAGRQLDSTIQNDTARVGGEYDQLQAGAAPRAAEPGTLVERPAAEVETPALGAAGAAPDPVPAADVSLETDVESSAQRMQDAGMMSEPAQLVQSGPIAEARDAHGELEQTAQEDPARVLAEQAAAIASAEGDMAALQARALEALNTSRRGSIQGAATQQGDMTGSEEQTRASVGAQAQIIFTGAQDQVRALLEPLPRTALARWEAGLPRLSGQFRSQLDDVKRRIEDRHSGIGGAILGAVDFVTGLPDWVVERYDQAEAAFGDGVCELIRDISRDVNAVVAAAEALIADARRRIDELFASLPADLAAWADEQRAQFSQRLDGLTQEVHQARDGFNRDLAQRASGAVQQVREEIHALRQAAGGLLGKIAAAVAAFLDDPVRFIINGLLSLLGIPEASFWRLVDRLGEVISGIADDPLGFASNLLDAVKQGFERFFGNIEGHLLQGLLDWLFSSMGSVGVQLPTDLSLRSVVTFFLQLMGLTWPNIRQILARHIGEENVGLLEQAYEIISTLIAQGPQGIFEMIKEQLDPSTILRTVMDAAIDMVKEALITRVALRIVAMLNPAGAILTAIEAIYRVIRWIFENAARIFTLVETIVNGAHDLMNGNVGGMAAAIESGLARLIPPVIDFLAGFIGLGDLPERIADVIRGLQGWVLGIVDRVVGFIATQARRLLAAVGIGRQEEPGEDRQAPEPGQLGSRLTVDTGEEEHSVWIVVQGGTATVMAASDRPGPIANLLANFRARANEPEFAAVKGEVLALIDGAVGHVANLDRIADDAANDPSSATFDQHTYDEKREEISETQGLLMATLRQIMEKLGITERSPEERLELFRTGSSHRPVMLAEPRFKPRGATNPAEQGYRRSSEVPWQLRDYLAFFATLGGAAPGPVRVTEAMWRTDIGKAVGNSPWHFARFGDARYVILDPPPAIAAEVVATGEEQLDERLENAVNALGIIEFMFQVARGRAPEGINRPELERLWGGDRSTPNRDFLKARFRNVRSGTHEWIPTDLIVAVVNRAEGANDLFAAAGWIWAQTELRTPTEQLIFDPDYASQTIGTGRNARRMLQGHTGALYATELLPNGTIRYVAQTVNQPAWHERLRVAFRESRSPGAAVGAASRIFQRTIWTGRSIARDLVDVYYRSPAGGAPVTVAELATLQVTHVVEITASFERVQREVS